MTDHDQTDHAPDAADDLPADPSPSDDALDGEPVAAGYAEALAELEGILTSLEAEQIDIDHLAERVARGAALVAFCRERIEAARTDVTRLVSDLDVLDQD